MAAFNLTSSEPSTFILMGIPGLQAAHVWISIPLAASYFISLMENFMLLYVVSKEQTLQKPMYLLLCMLALTEIAIPTAVVPKTLCIFWFNLKDITLAGCLTQIFFLATVSLMHSFVLVMMAFDRYVAICNPLRYTTILSKGRIAKLGLLCLIKAVLFVLPIPLLLSRLPFCSNQIIPHTFCESLAVGKIFCGDMTPYMTYSLVIALLISALHLSFIVLSYVLIIRAVLRISSKKAHQKALNTCTAHICVILLYYTPVLLVNLTQHFGLDIASPVNTILTNFYLLISPMLNPVIYGVKSKELRDKLGKYTYKMFSPWT